MHGTRTSVVRWISAATLSAALLNIGAQRSHSAAISARMAGLPRITVWAWERREDLREVDPRTTAVAYLDRTVVLTTQGLTIVPRRQPMLLPASTSLVRIAVVRVEVAEGTPLHDAEAEAIADAASEVARVTHPAALQIDFDARRSERVWYAQILRRHGPAMKACGNDAGSREKPLARAQLTRKLMRVTENQPNRQNLNAMTSLVPLS